VHLTAAVLDIIVGVVVVEPHVLNGAAVIVAEIALNAHTAADVVQSVVVDIRLFVADVRVHVTADFGVRMPVA
jgi:hypothetical protein